MELRFLYFKKTFGVLLFLLLPLTLRAEPKELLLQDFLHKVSQNNLDLKLSKAKVDIQHEGARGIRLPAPKIAVSKMNMQAGREAWGWQISQSFPFPSEITSDLKARSIALKTAKKQNQVIFYEVQARAFWVYFKVWQSQSKEKILKEKTHLLNEHIRLSQRLARSETLAQIHLLKAESQLDRTRNKLKQVKLERQQTLILAAQLLDEDPEKLNFQAIKPEILNLNLDLAVFKAPQVQAAHSNIEKYKALEKKAKAKWYPDFNLKYAHMQETQRFPENNQISLGISLPFVFFWQNDAEFKKASVQKMQAELQKQKLVRNIQAQKANLMKSIQSLKAQLLVLENNILPKAFKRKKIFQNIVPRDLSGLKEHLETYLAIPDTKLEILEMELQLAKDISQISKYINLKDKNFAH